MGDRPKGYRKARVKKLTRAAVVRAVLALQAARADRSPRPALGDGECCGTTPAECQVIVSGNTESIVADTLSVLGAIGAGVLCVDQAQAVGIVPRVAGGGYLYDDPMSGYGWVP